MISSKCDQAAMIVINGEGSTGPHLIISRIIAGVWLLTRCGRDNLDLGRQATERKKILLQKFNSYGEFKNLRGAMAKQVYISYQKW